MSRGSSDALTNWLRLAAVLYIYDRGMRRHMLETMRQAHGEKAWMDQIVDRMPRDMQHDLRNRIESDDLASAIEAKHFPHILKNNVLHFPELVGQVDKLKRAWKIRNRFAHPAGHAFDGARVNADVRLLKELIALIPGPGKEQAQAWELRLTSEPSSPVRVGGDVATLTGIREDVRSLRDSVRNLPPPAPPMDEDSIARRLADAIRPLLDERNSALSRAGDRDDTDVLKAIQALETRIERIPKSIRVKLSRKALRGAARTVPDRALKAVVEPILKELSALRTLVKQIPTSTLASDRLALGQELAAAVEPAQSALAELRLTVSALPDVPPAVDETALARELSDTLASHFQALHTKLDRVATEGTDTSIQGRDKRGGTPRAPVDDAEVQAYRERFVEARSGNGWTHTTMELGWRLTRWVGKSRGGDRAVVFAPSQRDEFGWATAGQQALMDREASDPEDAFRQLCEAERRGEVLRAAKEAITAHEKASPTTDDEDVVPF